VRTYPSRLTVKCPVCGGQVVTHMRFPIPEHWNLKPVEIVDVTCTTAGCEVTASQVRQLMQL
jgi:hypothetical protein